MNDAAAMLARTLNTIVLNKYHIADIIEFVLKIKMNLVIIIRQNNQNSIVGHTRRASAGTHTAATSIQDAQRKTMQLKAKLENAKQRCNPIYNFEELKQCKRQSKTILSNWP